MPPARTIIIDTDGILARVADIAAQQALDAHKQANERAEFWTSSLCTGLSAEQAKERADRERQAKLDELLPLAEWVPRDLERLTGKSLTASWRKRTQQAVKQLEADGLLVLDTRHVWLTDTGREHVAKLEGAAVDG